MDNFTKNYLINKFSLSNEVLNLSIKAENNIKNTLDAINNVKQYNQYKVIRAFQNNKISDVHFNESTGYGYGDIGRDNLEKVYKEIFV